MIDTIIAWAMRNRLAVAGAALLAAAFGLHAMFTMPVDAIPDLSENQVLVFTDWPGRGPQEVETQITQPLTLGLQGLAGIKTVRSSSMFGFSLVTVIFEDRVESAVARQRVFERLNFLGRKLPPGLQPALGPEATGLGWVFQYYLAVDPAKSAAGGFDLGELRALQDSFIAPQLSSVPGVAEVAGVGGFVKQYQIEVDPAKLRNAAIGLSTVLEAINASNVNVGGRTIEENGMEFVVRGVGLLHGAADLEKIPVAEKDGVPIHIENVARVQIGGDYRRGALDIAGHEVVGGIVIMRTGENARDVIRRVKSKIAGVQQSLPDGLTITPFYDRGALIERSLDTLQHTLTEEILLVILAHILFLWHFRSILIVTLPLPISILISFACLRQLGVTSNIMSMAGIAMAIGVLVDGAIVLTENALRRCGLAELQKGAPLSSAERFEVILTASRQVGRPVFFAMAIIICAFVPVFALSGPEGKLFHPLALAKTFAMLAAAALSITLVPALCTVFLRGPYRSEQGNFLMRVLLRIYDPVLDFALRRPRAVLGSAALVLACAVVLAFGLPASWRTRLSSPAMEKFTRGMGSEFMPPLNEGSLLFMPTFVPATSFSEVQRVMAWQDRVFAAVPEVQSAVGKLGRADSATDPAPAQMIETTITLKPESQWRPGLTRQALIHELTEKLQLVPGSVPGFLQPIQGRLLMISTGIRAQLGIKLLGDRPDELQKWALELEKIVRAIPGAAGVTASRTQGKPYLEIEPNREALARYGMRVQDIMDAVEIGLGGKEAGAIQEGRRRVPIQVRWQQAERDDLTRLRDTLITGPAGKVIPLGQLATIRRVEGPDELAGENGRLRAYVQANVDSQSRDLASFVEDVKARIDRDFRPHLPRGITIEYSGEYENQIHARNTLLWIVPCALLIIFILLHRVYRRTRDAAHVLLAVPFALSGGVFLQAALGIPFSVAVWVGYIALFGTAIQTAVVMVVYLDEAVARARREHGPAFHHTHFLRAVKDGARLRLRPKVMTVATIVLSLLPILWSTRTGAEVMRPIAVPVIGGMLSSLLHILIVTPVIYLWLTSRGVGDEGETAPAISRRNPIEMAASGQN
jgi:Cu(I)/Ag(I) efflux system membrane protein CusA/SilA